MVSPTMMMPTHLRMKKKLMRKSTRAAGPLTSDESLFPQLTIPGNGPERHRAGSGFATRRSILGTVSARSLTPSLVSSVESKLRAGRNPLRAAWTSISDSTRRFLPSFWGWKPKRRCRTSLTHLKVYDDAKDQARAMLGKSPNNKKGPVTKTITAYFKSKPNMTAYSTQSAAQKRIDLDIMILLARLSLPFSTVDHPAFKRYLCEGFICTQPAMPIA